MYRTFVSTFRLTLVVATAAIGALAVPPAAYSQHGSDGKEWRSYGADNGGTKYSPLDQITRENVKHLKIAWRWQSPANETSKQHPKIKQFIYETTPLFIDGTLYATTSLGQVAAIDPASGETKWQYDPQSYIVGNGVHGGVFIHRGVAYWTDGKQDQRIVLGTLDGKLIELDRRTGKPVEQFGASGSVDLKQGLERISVEDRYGLTSPPLVVGDVIVVGSSITDASPRRYNPRGDVRGFDARTGKQLWVFRSIPIQGEVGNDTWENESWKHVGNTNVWAPMSADDETGYVYLPFSTPTNDWYGGDRHGDNLFAESLVCVDSKTGERVWHFQMVHHGLWDYDLPAAPNLVDIRREGKLVKAVAQVSKQGFCYVFDRLTGEPIWPIEERAVPASTVPGEKAAKTQPYPTKPAPFDLQGLTLNDLIDFTPELRAEAVKIFQTYKSGPLFTPPTTEPFIQVPGAVGGANWTGAAVDPDSATLYVPSVTLPSFFTLEKPDLQESDAVFAIKFKEFSGQLGPQGLPLTKPPYGRVTAIDLNTGEHRWMKPLGEGPRNHPALKHLDLPRLGWPYRGAPLLTKTLLFVGQEARLLDTDFVLLWGKGGLTEQQEREISDYFPRLFVFDKTTGELIHEFETPLNVTSAPMTYMANGKQYIVFAIGGVLAPAELIAMCLP